MLPIDRTALIAAQTNQVPNALIKSALNIAAIQVPYDGVDELNNKVNGLVSTTSLSPYPPAQYNQLINGNFDLWQRGTVFTNPANNQFTSDHYKLVNGITGTLPTTLIHSQFPHTPGAIAGASFYYQLNTNGAGSAFGANDSYMIQQKIENGARYLCGAGKKLTLSFWARSSIAGKKLGVYFQQSYGTGGTPSASENINGNTFTLTGGWVKYSVTFTTNTLFGKTFGSNNDDYLSAQFLYAWGTGTNATVVNSVGVAETFGGSGTIDISQVQVNAGDVALPFQPRSFAEELALCQRYYEKSYSYATVPATATTAPGIETKIVPSNSIAANQSYGKISYKAKKRTPTSTVVIYPYTTPSNTGRVSDANGVDLAALSGGVFQNGDDGFTVYNQSGVILTSAGNAVIFHWASDSEI